MSKSFPLKTFIIRGHIGIVSFSHCTAHPCNGPTQRGDALRRTPYYPILCPWPGIIDNIAIWTILMTSINVVDITMANARIVAVSRIATRRGLACSPTRGQASREIGGRTSSFSVWQRCLQVLYMRRYRTVGLRRNIVASAQRGVVLVVFILIATSQNE